MQSVSNLDSKCSFYGRNDTMFALQSFGMNMPRSPDEYLVRFEARAARITVARASELLLWFVALFVCPGCLTHLIVFRFGDAFFKKLRTFAPSLGIIEPSSYETGRGVRA
jgi:hypothetical protein